MIGALPIDRVRAAIRCTQHSPVLVVGSINLDQHLLIDADPADDECATYELTHSAFGGHAFNCASALAQLGACTFLGAAVGTDECGKLAIDEVARAGIDPSFLLTIDGALTGEVLVQHYPAKRNMLFRRGANDAWAADDLLALVGAHHFSAVVVCDVGSRAQRLLRSVDADIKILSPGALYALDSFSEAVARADLTIVNRRECEQYRLKVGFGGGQAYGSPAGSRLIVTLGKNGALYAGEERFAVPSIDVACVDATGAGDTFVGGVTLAGIARLSAPDMLAFASIAAGLATRGLGARGSLPTIAEVERHGAMVAALAEG